MELTGILLAAGQGRRFGGGKLLHRLPTGEAIGVASYRKLRAALRHVLAVVRADDALLQYEFRTVGARVILCEDAQHGMSHSLLAGVRAAPVDHGLIIALADMPFVQAATITLLVQSIQAGALIAAPYYAGQRGNPVAFAPTLREELLLASGDAGAREVVKRHSGELLAVQCDDPGVVRDIDTQQDLLE
jgi:molybdenum cofactor cytidylyltransferase